MPRYIENVHCHPDKPQLQVLASAEETQDVLTNLISKQPNEILSVQRGAPRDLRLHKELPHDLAALRSGTEVRLLCQHTVRADLPTRAYISKVIEAGALVRTTSQLNTCMVIVDRNVAFIPVEGRENWSAGTVVIRETTLIHFLVQIFEQFWSQATPVCTEAAGYQGVEDDIKVVIAHLLAEGNSDELVARQMGMSTRTCRRHIAELMRALGVRSRFQAGVIVTRKGLLSDSAGNSNNSDLPARF